MTPELIAILAVGAALGGLMLWEQHRISVPMNRRGARTDRPDGRMDRLDAEMREIRDRLGAEMKEVRDRLGRLEGKVDFLESYIVGRDEARAGRVAGPAAAAAPPPRS